MSPFPAIRRAPTRSRRSRCDTASPWASWRGTTTMISTPGRTCTSSRSGVGAGHRGSTKRDCPGSSRRPTCRHWRARCSIRRSSRSRGRTCPWGAGRRRRFSSWVRRGWMPIAWWRCSLAGALGASDSRRDVFTPVAPGDGKFGGRAIPGVRIVITDRSQVETGRLGATLLWAIAAANGDSLRLDTLAFDLRFGDPAARSALLHGADPDQTMAGDGAGDHGVQAARRAVSPLPVMPVRRSGMAKRHGEAARRCSHDVAVMRVTKLSPGGRAPFSAIPGPISFVGWGAAPAPFSARAGDSCFGGGCLATHDTSVGLDKTRVPAARRAHRVAAGPAPGPSERDHDAWHLLRDRRRRSSTVRATSASAGGFSGSPRCSM